MQPIALHCPTVESLEETLALHHVNPKLWKGKTVQDLFEECKNGECVLELREGKLHRKVSVVSVHCFHTKTDSSRWCLIEEKQISVKKEIKSRGYEFVSEKMMPKETPHQAAVRALAEELQLSDPELQF